MIYVYKNILYDIYIYIFISKPWQYSLYEIYIYIFISKPWQYILYDIYISIFDLLIKILIHGIINPEISSDFHGTNMQKIKWHASAFVYG